VWLWECVCVCKWKREREREREGVCDVCVFFHVRTCLYVVVRTNMCVSLSAQDSERTWHCVCVLCMHIYTHVGRKEKKTDTQEKEEKNNGPQILGNLGVITPTDFSCVSVRFYDGFLCFNAKHTCLWAFWWKKILGAGQVRGWWVDEGYGEMRFFFEKHRFFALKSFLFVSSQNYSEKWILRPFLPRIPIFSLRTQVWLVIWGVDLPKMGSHMGLSHMWWA